MSISDLTPAQIAALTADQIAAVTEDDIASLTIPQLRHLTATQFSQMSAAQIGYFSPLQIAELAPATFAALAPSVLAELTLAQIAGLRLSEASVMTVAQAAALSPAQVATLTVPVLKNLSVAALQAVNGLTLAQVSLFSPKAMAELSAAQFSALVAPNFSAIGPGRLVDVTAAQTATLTAAEANGLTAGKLEALSGAAIGGMSAATLGALRMGLTQALTAEQLNGMGSAALAALDPARLTAVQLGELTAATVAGLSTEAFDALFANQLTALSTAAIAGVSVADLSSLSTPQLATFTSAQIAAMTPSQAIVVLGENTITADLLAHESNGALSYSGALAVLQDAANGGMSETKLSTLTSVAQWLASGTVQTSAYVAQIFSDVVLGNSANAWWTGGASTRVALGDLTASSSQGQFDELIDKWFLGTDLPSYSGYSADGYQTYNLPLFSAQGPQLTDVNQGEDGDCYFLAALASTAQQDPSLIKNMIQANGNNTYSVEFQVDGDADYVTVNNQLPYFNETWSNNSNMIFANNSTDMWVPLVEKAYAQLMEQSDAVTYNENTNSYAAIDGGDSNGLTAVTGQSVNELTINDLTSESTAQLDLNLIQAAFNAGNDVMVGTGGNAISNDWVTDHMYAVTAVNASAGTVTLYNPWGDAAASNGMDARFTATVSQLEAENVTLEYAVGARATA